MGIAGYLGGGGGPAGRRGGAGQPHLTGDGASPTLAKPVDRRRERERHQRRLPRSME